MPGEERGSRRGSTQLTVRLSIEGLQEGQKPPQLRIYLFTHNGRLVESLPYRGEPVVFTIDPGRDYRATVGPDLISGERPPADLASTLLKASSLSRDWLRQIHPTTLEFRIFPPIWRCWFPVCINVHGTVRKLLNPGGTPSQYAPLCTGTVQIFQVDLGCTLDSFTVIQLETLRTRLIEKVAPHNPGAPSTLGNANGRFANAVASSPAELADTLASLGPAGLKPYIVANNRFLWPFWCELIPDYLFCWQELTEVPIQSDGTFSAEICFWCPEDFPDLYFEVIQNLDGVDTEIYDPQIACSTFYGYDGSESVDIVIDDPRAVACQPTPNPGPDYLYVWPTAIGNVDLGNVNGPETGGGPALGEVTVTGPGGNPENAAWGGTLSLQMQFHPDLQANNIRYYRWSYQFADEASPTPIRATVTHRYQTITVSGSIITIHLNPVTFGPQLVSGPSNPGGTTNLFAIPDPTLPWIDINDPLDRPFAYFDSTELLTPGKSGLCTLILELFDGDGKFVPCNNPRSSSTIGDQPSDPAGPGAFTYILPQIGGPPNTYTNAPMFNITDHGRLTFQVLVDNRPTVAQLPGVSTPLGSTATDPCGVLHYSSGSDNVEIDYVAFQPGNFVDWSLTVSRGISGVVAEIVPPAPATGTSAGSPGSPVPFNNSASALLGPCLQAAFAVNLYCRARVTNGYGQQSQYDSSQTIAFALLHP